MATFVLVHGAWSGAHGFRHVRRELGAAGHAVFTPSLTGIGERAHLTGAGVDLTTHIRDVVNLVLYEDLDAIMLVACEELARLARARDRDRPHGGQQPVARAGGDPRRVRC